MRLVDYVVVLVLIAAGVAVAVGLSRPTTTSLPPASAGELQALEERLEALEGAPIREGAPAPERWTDADVAALRAGLEKIQEADQRGRDAQRLRQVVTRIVPDAEPALREEAVMLLLEAIQGARADPTQAGALRAALQEKLQGMFPAEVANRVAALLPVSEPTAGPR